MIAITGHPDAASARGSFRAGVTDYLTKPLSPERMLAAVAEALEQRSGHLQRRQQLATLRELAECLAPAWEARPAAGSAAAKERGNGVEVDLAIGVVKRDGAELPLTRTEYALVACLYDQRPRVLEPREIARAVRGEELESWEAREFCKAHVRNIRRKLEPDPGRPVHVVNVYGRGYRWSCS